MRLPERVRPWEPEPEPEPREAREAEAGSGAGVNSPNPMGAGVGSSGPTAGAGVLSLAGAPVCGRAVSSTTADAGKSFADSRGSAAGDGWEEGVPA